MHEVRGFVSEDLTEALKEAQAIAKGTRCKQFLFSVSLNPPESENVKVETFESAIERIEEKTGLAGQPRIVVFHEKEGRRHAHCVWSRIDAETMTARNLSHFKLKLRDVSRELYLEHDWQMPRGLMNSSERDPRNFSLAEWQQAKRVGQDARDLKTLMQECWAVSDSRAAFAQALEQRGLILAQGDRRGHVAVTHDGEVLSVARYTGKKTKEITARLGDPKDLPKVEEAKARHASEMAQTFQRHRAEAEQQKRRDLEPLEERRAGMARQQREERAMLEQKQQERWNTETREWASRLQSGMKGLWQRVSGEYTRVREQNEHEAYTAVQRDRQQREALIFAQMRERRELQRQIKTVREHHAALMRDIRQDRQTYKQMEQETAPTLQTRFRQAAAPAPTKAPQTAQAEAKTRAPSHAERLQVLRAGRQPKPASRGQDREPER
nr:relaxase/mobilization nuclease domain-containing protein [Rhodomicrobium sp. R_RK_3]